MKFVPRAQRSGPGGQSNANPLGVTREPTLEATTTLMGPQAVKSLVQLHAESKLHETSHTEDPLLSACDDQAEGEFDSPWARDVIGASRRLSNVTTTSSQLHPVTLGPAGDVLAAAQRLRFVFVAAYAAYQRRLAASLATMCAEQSQRLLVVVPSRDARDRPPPITAEGCLVSAAPDFIARPPDDLFDGAILLDGHALRLNDVLDTWNRRPTQWLVVCGDVGSHRTKAALQRISPRFALVNTVEPLRARWSNVVHHVMYAPASLRQLALLGAIQRCEPPVLVCTSTKAEYDDVAILLRDSSIELGHRGVVLVPPWGTRLVPPTRNMINFSLPRHNVAWALSDRVDDFCDRRGEEVCYMITFVDKDAVMDDERRTELASLLRATGQLVPRFMT